MGNDLSRSAIFSKKITIGNEVLFVFCSPTQAKCLKSAQRWLCDGTFSTCPTGYAQQYIIHAWLEEHKLALPCAFFLMTSRTTTMYNACLNALISYGLELGIRFYFFTFYPLLLFINSTFLLAYLSVPPFFFKYNL